MIINGKRYSWSSIQLSLLGNLVMGITSINYMDEEEINGVKGASKYDIGYTQENVTCSGSITLLREELDAIQKAAAVAGIGRIQDIPAFAIPVSYADENGIIHTDTLRSVKFKKRDGGGSAGSTDALSSEIDLYIGKIDWAVV